MLNIQSNNSNSYKRHLISKKMKIFFILSQIFLSLDFGFIEYKSKQMKLWVKLCVFTCGLCQGTTILIVLYTLFYNSDHQMWGIKFFVEYYLYILILILTPDNKTFCSYQIKLLCFDEDIRVESSTYKIDVKLFLYWSLLAFYDIIAICLFNNFSDERESLVFLQSIYYIPARTYSFPLVVLFFIFYSAYCRLVKLKIYIKKRDSSTLHAHQLYRYLLDSLENVLKYFKYILLVHMMFNIPTVIASVYIVLKVIRDTEEINFTVVAPYIDLLPIMTVEFAPILASSWLSTETKNIKILLHDQLLEESDENQTRAIEKFIRYIEVRPFKFYMMSIIPMDTSLLITLLNLCITYIIICLQLTHIY